MTFTEQLDILIKMHKITRTELARQINVSEGTVRSWYQGKQPTLDKLLKISNYFSISIDKLVGNVSTNEIEELYNKLNETDKQIVDLILNKYRDNKPELKSSTSMIG